MHTFLFNNCQNHRMDFCCQLSWTFFFSLELNVIQYLSCDKSLYNQHFSREHLHDKFLFLIRTYKIAMADGRVNNYRTCSILIWTVWFWYWNQIASPVAWLTLTKKCLLCNFVVALKNIPQQNLFYVLNNLLTSTRRFPCICNSLPLLCNYSIRWTCLSLSLFLFG